MAIATSLWYVLEKRADDKKAEQKKAEKAEKSAAKSGKGGKSGKTSEPAKKDGE